MKDINVATATVHMSGSYRRAFPNMTIIGHEDNVPTDLDLLIMTGGSDVNPERYGAPMAGSYGVDDERDEREFSILSKALEKNPKMKVLGVCRGLQVINVAFGGTLYQDLPSMGIGHHYSHKIRYSIPEHPMSWLDNVNSLHHQSIASVGGHRYPASIVAKEPRTGVIEAIVWGETAFAVQFHPEMFTEDKYSKFFDLIKAWVRKDVGLNPGAKIDEGRFSRAVNNSYFTINATTGTSDIVTTLTPVFNEPEEQE